MTTFFTSDSHFGHARILELGVGRPFRSVTHMNQTLLANIFEMVTPEDTFIHLGDAAMGDFSETIQLMAMIPGTKFFVPGNHDKIFPKLNTAARIERYTPMYEDAGFTVLPIHSPLELTLSDGSVETVLLTHVPSSPERYGGRADKLAFARPKDTGKFIVHGHTHATSPTSEHPREYNVGVDAHDFRPVSEHTVIAWIEAQKAKGF